MSEIKSLAAPKASFDRRAVVKGAAWSLPVIAAAIAAPAAAASTPQPTLSAGLVLGTTAPTVIGTRLMHGTGPKGFAVATTGAAVAGAISVVIAIEPDAAAKTAGIGLAVTASALPPSGQSSPYDFVYTRTGTSTVPKDAVLSYTVTVTVTVVESATKKTVLPAMVFVASLKPVLSASIVPSTADPIVTGTPAVLGTGPKGFSVSTTGAVMSGTASVSIAIDPADTTTANSGIGLVIGKINNTAVSAGSWSGALAVPAGGTSEAFTFGSYSRTGNGSAPNKGTVLNYTVTVTVTVIDSATNERTTLTAVHRFATLRKP
ncbi:hypothetical protein [Arthrobacter humicola]|uniref:hypothetical protein n=1 Tax=Arthrobacter humicola TaxID=409291 RepID=UPI001FAD2F78|nr:hypothetical protein [Arthrobacter humicola]MCI9872592.1 hypothetical protein [Arthrobacter humicola]